MMLELSGRKNNFKNGVQYLKDQGVNVKNAAFANYVFLHAPPES